MFPAKIQVRRPDRSGWSLKILILCSFFLSVRLCWTNFMQIFLPLTSSKRIRPTVTLWKCTWTSTNFRVTWQFLATSSRNLQQSSDFQQLMVIHSLDHPQGVIYSFIFINSFKHFMCYCSYFPEFETKFQVCSLLHGNKE